MQYMAGPRRIRYFSMDIRTLTLFKHLAGSLHFGRTSRACHITPSALTRTVQRLEEELGHALFVRDNRSVALTQAGKRFLIYAEEVIQCWQDLSNDLAGDGVLRGEMSLYCSVTAVYGILPELLGRFRERYPDVHITLQTGDAARAVAKVQSGEADVTIAALPEKKPSRLHFLKMLETPLVFIAPRRFPETVVMGEGGIDWRQTPVIMAERGLSRKWVADWFLDKKVEPNIYARVAGNEAIIAMVSLGCGIGVVPKLVLEKSPLRDQVSELRVVPELAPFTVGVCTTGRNLTNPVVRAFWEVAAGSGEASP